MEARIRSLEERVTAIEKVISKEAKIAAFEESFGSSPKPLEYTGKIKSPAVGDKFVIPDFSALGGRLADYSSMLTAVFVPDNPSIQAMPKWYSSIDGDLEREGTDVALMVKSPGKHVIIAKYGNKVLDYVIVDAEVVDCAKCGG